MILPGSGLAAGAGAVVLQGSHHWIETESTIAAEADCMAMMPGETGHVKKAQAEGRMITTIGAAETGKRTGEPEGDRNLLGTHPLPEPAVHSYELGCLNAPYMGSTNLFVMGSAGELFFVVSRTEVVLSNI